MPKTGAEFLAYQDGSGAWKTLMGTGSEASFTVTDPQGRYTVVFGQKDGDEYRYVRVWNATVGELSSLDLTAEEETIAPAATATITGTLANIAEGEQGASVTNGQAWGWAMATQPDFSLATTTGTYDLAAICRDGNWRPTRVALKRGLAINGDLNLGTWDMNAEALPLGGFTVRTDGLDGYSHYLTSRGTVAGWGGSPVVDGAFNAINLAPSQRAAGDLIWVEAYTEDDHLGREFSTYAGVDPAGTSTPQVPMGTGLESATLATAGTPARAQITWTGPQGATFYYLGMEQGRDTEYVRWQVVTTAKALGSATSFTLPDMAGIPGYDATWNISDLSAGTVEWGIQKFAANNGWVAGSSERRRGVMLKAGDLIQVVSRWGSSDTREARSSRGPKARKVQDLRSRLHGRALPQALREAMKAAPGRK